MGPRGCITYSPAIVLRQLGWIHRKPLKEQLGGCCFRYANDKDVGAWSGRARTAWRDVKVFGNEELGMLTWGGETPEYTNWRGARGVTSKAQNEKIDPKTAKMERQMTLTRTTLRSLREEKEVAEFDASHQRTKIKILEYIKGNVERDLEAATTNSSQGKKRMVIGQVKELEAHVQRLIRENDKLTVDVQVAMQSNQKSEAEYQLENLKIQQLQVELEREVSIKKELENSCGHLKSELRQVSAQLMEAYSESARHRNQFQVSAERVKGLTAQVS